jgi:hypothetical protein
MSVLSVTERAIFDADADIVKRRLRELRFEHELLIV